MKTNAVRFLERLGVPFELRAYEVDSDELAAVPDLLVAGDQDQVGRLACWTPSLDSPFGIE